MKFASKILTVLFVSTLFAIPAFAQTGAIAGKVFDEAGKPMAGVTITIDRKSNGQHFEVKVDARGQYLHSGLPGDVYKVTVVKDGKQVTFLDNVRVSTGATSAADFDFKALQAAAGSAEDRAKLEADKAKQEAVKSAFDGGRAALTAKNYPEAARLFQEAAEKDQTQHVIFANLADALGGARKYDDAAAAYKKAIELKPDEAAYYNNLGIVLGNAGKIEDASAALQKAAEMNPPGAAQSYFNLGAVLTNRGRTADAATAFKKAIEYDPMMAIAYYQLGISYMGTPATMGDAVTNLEKFLAMAPTDPNAEAAKALIDAAKQAAPTAYKSEKAIAEEKAAAEKAAKAKADAEKANAAKAKKGR